MPCPARPSPSYTPPHPTLRPTPQTFQTALFWLGLVTALVNLHPLGETWKGLGGTLRIVQSRFGVLLPEVLPLLMCAATAFAFDEQAIEIAPWATPYSTAALVWQSAAAGLVIVVLAATLLAAAVWDVGFLLHAGVGVVFVPLALVTTVTSSLALSRSNTVYAFVEAHWDDIKQFVPPSYPHVAWDKYAADAYTPMAQAGVSGMLLAVLLWMGAMMHFRCAAIQMSVGPELYALQVAAEDEKRARDVARHRAALRAGDDDEGVEVTCGSLVMGCAQLCRGRCPNPGGPRRSTSSRGASYAFARPDGGYGSAAASATANGGIPAFDGIVGGRDSAGGVAVSTASSVGLDSPSAAAQRDYGAISSHGAAAGGAVLGGEDVLSRFRAAAYARHSYQANMYGSSAGRVSASAAAAAIGTPLANSGAAAIKSYTEASARKGHHRNEAHAATAAYFSYMGPQPEEAALEASIPPVPLRDFFAAMRIEGVAAWAAHRSCMLVFLLLSVASLAGMSAGLAVLEAQGRCGVLARAPVEVTYTRSFSLYEANSNVIYITNEYPYGSVEVVAPQFIAGDNNFTIEVTSYAPSADLLLTYDQFMAGANLSDYSTVGDDDSVFGYVHANLAFRPPGDAASACRGLRVRVYSVFYATYVINSGGVLVNVTGDLSEVSGDNFASKTLTSVNVTTDTGPVVLYNLHVEPANRVVPTKFIPNGLYVVSNAGDVTLTNVLALNPTVHTGGTIRSSDVVSTAPLLECRTTAADGTLTPAICGNVYYTATGQGRVSVSQGLGGDSVFVSTESGEIVFANAAVVAGHDVHISSSGGGDIYLSTFIQAAGNETFVSTNGGKLTASAVFVNRAYFTVTGDASLSIVEAFVGLAPPGILVLPNVTANNATYGDPLLFVRAERGDISILGAGGNAPAPYANSLTLDIATTLGNIKMEVAGGGVNGA